MTNLAQNLVLKHSYDFEDGTAKDLICQAHGTINGVKVINREYVTFSGGQYIDMPTDKININTSKSISLEVYLGAGYIHAAQSKSTQSIVLFFERIEN